MTWKRFPYLVFFCCQLAKAVEHTDEFSVIWDAITLVWRYRYAMFYMLLVAYVYLRQQLCFFFSVYLLRISNVDRLIRRNKKL